jgi:phage tail protein X
MEVGIAMAREPLDALLNRKLGRTAGVTEQALLLNPGLADLGPALPAGTRVLLPEVTAAQPVRETVKLWG